MIKKGNSKLRYLAALLGIGTGCFLSFSKTDVSSGFDEVREAEQMHEISYQQEELSGMLYTCFAESSKREDIQEEAVRDYLPAGKCADWAAEQMDRMIMLDVYTAGDGYVSFTAFDPEQRSLTVVVVNQTEEIYGTKIRLEEANRKNPASVQTFSAAAEPEAQSFYRESSSGIYTELEPGGYGIIKITTGILYGGSLSESESNRADLTDLVMETGSSGFADQTHGLLRIYSSGDIEINSGADPEAAGDYATYSLTAHLIYYDVSANTRIRVNRGASSGNLSNFKIELRNSRPVTIAHIDSGDLGNVPNKNYKFSVEAMGMANTLNIVNETGHAIAFGRYLHLSGPGIIYADGSVYGITTISEQNYVDGQGAYINVENGFGLHVSGGSGGIYLSSNINPQAAPIESWTSLNVTGRSWVRADSKNNQNGYGIYITGEIYAGTLSYVEGSGAGTGIYTSRLYADQSDAAAAENMSYASKSDLDNENRTRIAGFGSITGIEMNTNSNYSYPYAGRGTLIYAEGNEQGMIVRRMACDSVLSVIQANNNTGRPVLLYNSTEALLYGTIMAVGTSLQSNGLQVHFPDTEGGTSYTYVRYGTRYVVQGGEHGLYKTTPNNHHVFIQFEYLSELIAYGKNGAGAYIDAAGVNPYSNLIFNNKAAGYLRGGQYGVYIEYGNFSVFGTDSGQNVPNRNILDPEDKGMGCRVTAIGGIGTPENPAAGMEAGELADPAAWLTASDMKLSEIPEPVTDEKGVIRSTLDENGEILPEKRNTYGVLVRRYEYIAAYDRKTELKMYGGHIGAATAALEDIGRYENVQRDFSVGGTYIVSYEGAILEGIGGVYGTVSNTYIHVWSQGYFGNRTEAPVNDGIVPAAEPYLTGNSIYKRTGSKYGLLTLGNNGGQYGYITALGATYADRLGRSYIYGYGEVNGIYAQGGGGQGYINVVPGSAVVAETILDASATGTHPHAQPAINCTGNFQSTSAAAATADKGLIHEMYQAVNFNIETMPPYVLNRELEAVGTQLGTTPATLLKFYWTTPENHPSQGADGRHWLDYDAEDDQRLVKPVTVNGESGLAAFGNARDITLVGECIGSIHNISTGKLASGAYAEYRITLKTINTSLRNRMNIEADLYEDFMGVKTRFTDDGEPVIPLETVYELEARIPDEAGNLPEDPVLTSLNAGAELDRETGRIRMTGLKMGEYWLRPRVDIGYPYGELLEIHFICKIDTDAVVPGEDTTAYPNYADYWYEKLYLSDEGGTIPSVSATDEEGNLYIKSLLNPEEGGRPYADITERGARIADSSSDQDVYRVGKMDLSYFYQKHRLEFVLKDIDSGENIPGSFQLTASRNGQEIPGLMQILTGTADADGKITWDMLQIYPEIDYKLKQLTADLKPYMKTSEEYAFRIHKDDAKPVITEKEPRKSYESGTSDDEVWHYVYAFNDLPVINVKLHLIDSDKYAEFPFQSHLETEADVHIPGRFELQTAYMSEPDQLVDITAEYLTDHNDGTFTLTLKPYRSKYMIRQTSSALGYNSRISASLFVLDNLIYDDDNTALISYEIHKISASDPDDSGWVAPEGWDQKSIWITNVKTDYNYGELPMTGGRGIILMLIAGAGILVMTIRTKERYHYEE